MDNNNILDSTAQQQIATNGILANALTRFLIDDVDATWPDPQPLAAGLDAFRLNQYLVERCKAECGFMVGEDIVLQFSQLRNYVRLERAINELGSLDRVRIWKDGNRIMLLVNPMLLVSKDIARSLLDMPKEERDWVLRGGKYGVILSVMPIEEIKDKIIAQLRSALTRANKEITKGNQIIAELEKIDEERFEEVTTLRDAIPLLQNEVKLLRGFIVKFNEQARKVIEDTGYS